MATMNLFQASNQWATRPADERFPSLEAMHEAVTAYRAAAREAMRPYRDLSVQPQGTELMLVGKAGNPARMTHWAFGQFCARIQAPAGFLRELPVELTANVVNDRLRARGIDDDEANMLFHNNGSLLVRSFNSERYGRIWNSDITKRLLALKEQGPWQEAPAAFDGTRGQYASDHDMFSFLVDNDRRIFESAPGGGLSRGLMVWNSEVGAAKFGVMGFLYAYVCGNHIIWGASQVKEFSVRHIGDADVRGMREFRVMIREYADGAASLEEARIKRAMSFEIAGTKEGVLDKIFALRIPVLSRDRILTAYNRAEEHTDWYGSPRSAWGLSNGLTEVSQASTYADDRVAIDRAASKVLELAF